MRLEATIWVLTAAMAAGCGGGTGTTGDVSSDTIPGDTTVDGDVVGDPDTTDDADAPDDGDEVVWPATCDGYTTPPSYPPSSGADCLEEADCPGGEFCRLPGMVICGACPPPTRECETSEDCTDGVCIEVPPLCDYCPGGNSSHCIPWCTEDSCADVGTCDDETGLCVPTPCSEGWTCPENTRCGTSGGDDHGCVTLTCTTHDECDCGVCASGRCISGPGACSGPVP